MASRLLPRLYTFGAAALPRRDAAGGAVRRVLIAHHLLLGDTIMLTPLIKKASERFPDAEIVMTCPAAYASLYAGRPYGVTALPFDARSLADHRELRRQRGFDLALVPADNRWSLLARAMDARWIVAFATDEPSAKNWPIDEMRRMPDTPMAWGEIAATLLDGPDPAPYSQRMAAQAIRCVSKTERAVLRDAPWRQQPAQALARRPMARDPRLGRGARL